MSLHDYRVSQKISVQDHPFYALIMAAFRQADSDSLGKLRCAFPLTWLEFIKRYNAPGGRLGEELLEQVTEELPETILGRKVIVEEVGPRHVNLTLGGLDVEGFLRDRGEEVSEEPLPETIMGMPVKVTEACPNPPGILILGSFDDYDLRSEEEKELDAEFRKQMAAKKEEPDGTKDPSHRSRRNVRLCCVLP